LASALLFDEKSAKVPHYFGLDCKILELLQYSTHEPSSKEELLTLPHFWSPILALKITVCAHTTRPPKKLEK
jgi:hypothetical protein